MAFQFVFVCVYAYVWKILSYMHNSICLHSTLVEELWSNFKICVYFAHIIYVCLCVYSLCLTPSSDHPCSEEFLKHLFCFWFQVPVMELVCVSRLRRWRLVSIANTSVNFVERWSIFNNSLCFPIYILFAFYF